MKNRGFTLIETIITLVIMAVLTTLAARTIQQAFRAKAKIEDQIDLVSQVKDTLRLFERDVNLAYHYQDLEKELKEDLQKDINKKCQPQQQGQPQGQQPGQGQPTPTPAPQGQQQPGTTICKTQGYDKAYLVKTENRADPTTHFVAKENALNFVTSNTVRFMKDSPQADFSEIGYFIETCKNRPDKKFESGQCLFRRFSSLVDKDVTKGGTATQLIADVTEFKLKYYAKVQKDWRNEWNSTDDGGEASTKGRYPEAIEVNLTVEPPAKSASGNAKGKKKKVSIQMIIPIHFPNNKETNENPNAQNQIPPQ